MKPEKRKALEAIGWRIGDAADFLGLTEEERLLVELRIKLAERIRQLRKTRRLSQKQVADRLKSTQPRVARIEAASSDVSLDLMFRGLFVVGGRLSDLEDAPQRSPRQPASD